ncbi:hypothetical protein KKC60_05875 [Patescibacteria group bacterium]|nr:hypothetical protein [Patescibacteria group bacterium]
MTIAHKKLDHFGDTDFSQYFTVSLEDGNIIVIKHKKAANDERMIEAISFAAGNQALSILEKEPRQKFQVLLDLRKLGRKITKPPTTKTEGGFVEILSNEQIDKLAFLTVSSFLNVMTFMMGGALGKKGKIKGFKDEVKAKKWLKEA